MRKKIILDSVCPICKAQNIIVTKSVTSIYTNRFCELAQCGVCGHLFLLNFPSTRETDAIYKTIYNYGSHWVIQGEKKWRFWKLGMRIRRIIPLDARIIDIGCGYGSNLEVFRELGYPHLLGIEINPSAVNRCKKNNLDVFEGSFSQWLQTKQKIFAYSHNCILLSHVIEHIHDINEFFDEVDTFLKSGDYIIVLLPNYESFTSVFFGRFWGWWQVPAHLHHFSKDSILRLLSLRKYSVIMSFVRGADSLFWLSSIASLLSIKSKSQNISKLQRLIIKFFSFLSKYWLFFGDEEFVVISRKR
jgi:SAM-dependent methyltransferase